MYALRKLEEYLRSRASPTASRELSRLLEALREEKDYPLSSLCEIDYEAFELAVEAMRDWRIDRYYAGKSGVAEGTGRATESPVGQPS